MGASTVTISASRRHCRSKRVDQLPPGRTGSCRGRTDIEIGGSIVGVGVGVFVGVGVGVGVSVGVGVGVGVSVGVGVGVFVGPNKVTAIKPSLPDTNGSGAMLGSWANSLSLNNGYEPGGVPPRILKVQV
jgi:hypothetical protein